MFEEVDEPLVDMTVDDEVVVIQDEDHLLAQTGRLIDQGRKGHVDRTRARHPEPLAGLRTDARHDSPEGFDHIDPELDRVVVTLVERKPGDWSGLGGRAIRTARLSCPTLQARRPTPAGATSHGAGRRGSDGPPGRAAGRVAAPSWRPGIAALVTTPESPVGRSLWPCPGDLQLRRHPPRPLVEMRRPGDASRANSAASRMSRQVRSRRRRPALPGRSPTPR